MQVFNTFFKIVKKQLPSFIIYFSIFGVLIGFMSNMGTGNNAYKESRMDIAIFNNDGSAKADYLEEYLGTIHDVMVIEDDEETIQDYLYFQVLDYVLYIDEGFELTNIKRPGSKTGIYVDNHIANFEKTYDAFVLAGYSEAEAYEKTMEAMDTVELVSLKGESGGKPTIFYFYLYFTYIVISLLINTLAPVIIALNRKEVKERSMMSPFSDKKRNGQIIAGSVLFSLVIWGIMNILSFVVCGFDLFKADNMYYLLNSVCYLILSVGVVCIVSNFNLKAEAISMISNIVSLSLSFLSGVFVPMEIFGEGMMRIAKCTPTYWYVRGCYNISDGIINNETFMYMGIQLLFALAFFAVALVISKRVKLSRAN